jgi:hypothetical protein
MMQVMAKKKGQGKGAKGRGTHGVMTPSGFAWLTKKEFKAELSRRIDEIESGKVKTIPWDVVKQRLRAKAQRRGDH